MFSPLLLRSGTKIHGQHLECFVTKSLKKCMNEMGDTRTCSNPEVARFRGLNTSRIFHPRKIVTQRRWLLGATKRGTSPLGNYKKHPPASVSKDLYFQASKSVISSLEKKSSFSCPCSIIQPQQMGNSVSFFPPLPKHISTTPTSFPPFLGFQTGFQLCNLPGPRSIWLKNWVTGGFHSFLRVMKTPRLCSVVLLMQKKTLQWSG